MPQRTTEVAAAEAVARAERASATPARPQAAEAPAAGSRAGRAPASLPPEVMGRLLNEMSARTYSKENTDRVREAAKLMGTNAPEDYAKAHALVMDVVGSPEHQTHIKAENQKRADQVKAMKLK